MSAVDKASADGVGEPSTVGAVGETITRIVVWAAFLAIIYAIRDFFFIAFFTFLFSYLDLTIVGWVMGRMRPDRDRPAVRRLVTVGVFVFAPVLFLFFAIFVVPPLIAQGQRFVGWLSRLNPEAEAARLAEK